jgi:protein O-mannosyl-transferase
MSGPSVRSSVRVGIPVLLAVVVAATFLPVLRNGFVDWDDQAMIVDNPFYKGFSASHLWWMFSSVAGGHYQPLSWLTLAIDHRLWGSDPLGYHLTNLLLHVANVVAFYALALAIYRRLPWAQARRDALVVGATVAALFFAVHPLRVESVAWVTERRDVLSALFYLLTVLAYLRAQKAGGADARRGWLVLSLGFMLLSVLSKAWGMTLPVVLLALDAYPLGRFGADPPTRRRVLLEKVPYAVLAVGTVLMAAHAVARDVVMHSLTEHSILSRLTQVAYGLCFYLWKTLLPVRLSPLYLLDSGLTLTEGRHLLCVLAVLAMTVVALLLHRRQPWLLVVWISFAAIVSPVLGLYQSGPQLVADRYTYLAMLPWALLLGAGAAQLWRRARPPAVVAAAVAVVGMLAVLTHRQAAVWHDAETLWSQALRVDPGNYIAYGNRGLDREARGDLSGARTDLDRAIELNPEYALAYNNRGALRKRMGDLRGAVADWEAGLRAAPPGSPWHAMLAQNLALLRGQPPAAADAQRPQ